MDDSPVFSSLAFDLLMGLHKNPTATYYFDYKTALKDEIDQPLHGLMARVAARLPQMMLDRLETRRNVFSHFLKNDFGRGMAWDNYWCAFYPKGSRRIMDAQLAVWMDAWHLQISFFINDYGVIPRQRFLRNCRRYRSQLPDWLSALITNEKIRLGLNAEPVSWSAWLDNPAQADFIVRAPFSPEEITNMPGRELEDWVVLLFSDYFPLALLAMEEEPLALVNAYRGT